MAVIGKNCRHSGLHSAASCHVPSLLCVRQFSITVSPLRFRFETLSFSFSPPYGAPLHSADCLWRGERCAITLCTRLEEERQGGGGSGGGSGVAVSSVSLPAENRVKLRWRSAHWLPFRVEVFTLFTHQSLPTSVPSGQEQSTWCRGACHKQMQRASRLTRLAEKTRKNTRDLLRSLGVVQWVMSRGRQGKKWVHNYSLRLNEP